MLASCVITLSHYPVVLSMFLISSKKKKHLYRDSDTHLHFLIHDLIPRQCHEPIFKVSLIAKSILLLCKWW